MLNSQQKNAIIMAHDLTTVLNLMGQKVQDGQEIQEEDLKLLPTMSTYATRIMTALLEANTEPEETTDIKTQGGKKVKTDKVHEGETIQRRVNDDGSEEWGE